jgi:hypothetical protein
MISDEVKHYIKTVENNEINFIVDNFFIYGLSMVQKIIINSLIAIT